MKLLGGACIPFYIPEPLQAIIIITIVVLPTRTCSMFAVPIVLPGCLITIVLGARAPAACRTRQTALAAALVFRLGPESYRTVELHTHTRCLVIPTQVLFGLLDFAFFFSGATFWPFWLERILLPLGVNICMHAILCAGLGANIHLNRLHSGGWLRSLPIGRESSLSCSW